MLRPGKVVGNWGGVGIYGRERSRDVVTGMMDEERGGPRQQGGFSVLCRVEPGCP